MVSLQYSTIITVQHSLGLRTGNMLMRPVLQQRALVDIVAETHTVIM